MKLIKGKTPKDATRPPTEVELKHYARQLRDELDAFIDDQQSLRHRILVGKGGHHGIVSIAFDQASTDDIPVEVVDIKKSQSSSFEAIQDPIRKRHNQWVYSERGVIPKYGHAALCLACFFVDGCVKSSFSLSSAFNSARHSSGVQCQFVRRSLAIAA